MITAMPTNVRSTWILESTVNTAAAIMLLCLMTPAGAAAGPQLLEDQQLDAVTAGGVLVDVSSFAGAFGDRARTLTDAKTFAVIKRNYDLGVGLTFGHGYACCGEPAAVEVGSSVLGVGDIVRRGTRALKYDDNSHAQGLSAGYVVALTFKEPRPVPVPGNPSRSEAD
jgi:hypothetical protein